MTAASVWIDSRSGGLGGPREEGVGEVVALTLAFYAYLGVGLLLISKRPENSLGWVLTGVGLLTTTGVLATEYAELAFETMPDAGLPGATFAAWVNEWWWYPLLGLMMLFVPLLFPTGRPPTPRWLWLLRACIGLLGLVTVAAMVTPQLRVGDHAIANPIGVRLVGDIEEGTVGTLLFGGLAVCIFGALASLVVRFRRSRGIERQQLKWFVYAGFVTLMLPITEEAGLDRWLPDSNVFFAIGVALLPLAIGVSILRYRLYDIDRIISRTVTYLALTALLVAVYLGAVTALTAITAPVTGDSPVAVAAATLLAAAAFRPARRRIQATVDRRFNRARYDAARTVEDYRARLRDDLDLTSITADLQQAVEATVQPARSIVWLRPEHLS